jgi:hypothetical protein
MSNLGCGIVYGYHYIHHVVYISYCINYALSKPIANKWLKHFEYIIDRGLLHQYIKKKKTYFYLFSLYLFGNEAKKKRKKTKLKGKNYPRRKKVLIELFLKRSWMAYGVCIDRPHKLLYIICNFQNVRHLSI